MAVARLLVGLTLIAYLVAGEGDRAAQAATGTFTGAVDVSGTSFRGHTFIVGGAGTIRAVLDWSQASANLNLMLFNPSGSIVAGAYSTSKPETIVYEATSTGTWKLGVKAKSGASAYTLSVEYPGGATSALSAVDRASTAGIAQTTTSYGTYVYDFDRDGDEDFLYNRHTGSAMLFYVNDGEGHFQASSTSVFPRNDRHDCVWADLDANSLPDFYCALGASGGKLVKANELWLQTVDGRFTSVSGAWGATDPYGRGREPALLDVNNDGLLDLFVGNFYPRPDGVTSPNRFFAQDAVGSFSPAPDYGLDEEIGGQCAEPADLDQDGFMDLVVCASGQFGGLKLFANIGGGRFTDVADARGITGQWCDASVVDLNGDGRLDLTLMSSGTFQVRLQAENGSFPVSYQRSMQQAGCHFGAGGDRVASGDVDLDGDVDLYVLYSGYTDGKYNLPDVFLVNDGTGRTFTTASIPQTKVGSGFSVASIQADADPAPEFLVTNGRGTFKGPIQLVDFLP
jgi:hypothetical protein